MRRRARSKIVVSPAPDASCCIFCDATSGCACRNWREARRRGRRNPDRRLSEVILGTLPEEAHVALRDGLRFEVAPSDKGEFKPWAIQGDDVWERLWYVPGFLVQDGTLQRTIWRFDEDGDKERIEAIDVDDPSYFALMEGYCEDSRVSSWRDYFTWVIQHGRDPLDELKVEDDELEARKERWVCAVQDVERLGRTIGVELLGAKPEGAPGPLRPPSKLPGYVTGWFRAVREGSNGSWILMDGYRSVREFAADLEGRNGVVGDAAGNGILRFVVALEAPDRASAFTPRTEIVRSAAVDALRALTV